jgi:hypothetical protein
MKMNQLNAKDTDNSKDTTTVIAADAERAWKMFLLRQGDLPGYTGWARPSNTSLVPLRYRTATVQEWSIIIDLHMHCHHAQPTWWSLFFVRAHGPAILPGLVTDHGNGTYDVTFFRSRDSIRLKLSWHFPGLLRSDFPVPMNQPMRDTCCRAFLYKWMLVRISISKSSSNNQQQACSKTQTLPPCPAARQIQRQITCNMSLLTGNLTKSALASGRWVPRENDYFTGSPTSRQSWDDRCARLYACDKWPEYSNFIYPLFIL